MGIDIRLPLGALFSLLGLILIVYGAVSDASRYQQSLGININLDWGIVLLIFGLLMLLLARRSAHASPPGSASRSSDSAVRKS
jgi:membrane-bound ClpP family serine protease